MTYEEHTTEVLSRFSVQDLVEQTDADLERADEMFYNSDPPLAIADRGKVGNIDWWEVKSGEHSYIVRRFKNFCWCSCRDWFYRRKACKHIATSTNVSCANCHELPARNGKYCPTCDLNINHFLRQTKPVEFTEIGSRR